MNIVGLDIGGANLKAATADGASRTRPFPLWREPEQLENQLRELIRPLGQSTRFALTMTAELADCFTTKAEGVSFVLSTVERLADGAPVSVWQTGGEFVAPDIAREIPLLVSAANWHALATWLGRVVPRGPAILIDIGSTTTDIIPLRDGRPVSQGLTDRERLQQGELLYTGIRRSPLCALAHSVPLADGHCPMAAELFATTLDIHVILGLVDDEPENNDTADGRPATRTAAMQRLARMVCCDENEVSGPELESIAEFLHNVQKQRIRGCLDRVRKRLPDPNRDLPHLLISGAGSFLAEAILKEHAVLARAESTHLSAICDPDTAQVACAAAVARLAKERSL